MVAYSFAFKRVEKFLFLNLKLSTPLLWLWEKSVKSEQPFKCCCYISQMIIILISVFLSTFITSILRSYKNSLLNMKLYLLYESNKFLLNLNSPSKVTAVISKRFQILPPKCLSTLIAPILREQPSSFSQF